MTSFHPVRDCKSLTGFQKRVYEIVSKIPKGKVMTYKEVAIGAGKSRAFRAVGNILNKNKDPEIPCHRVIHSDRTLGGYNGGVDKKEIMLKKEGLTVVHDRVKIS